jgi:hypothetical protein
LEGGPPGFARSSTSSVLLWNADNNGGQSQPHTGLSPAMAPLSRGFCLRHLCNSLSAPSTPGSKLPGLGYIRFRSPLLTESRFDFLSCRYLDVSVSCVRFNRPMHSADDDRNWLPSPDRFPHWEIPGLTVARHLPRAYRSQPRPSSPLGTKTSPIHT